MPAFLIRNGEPLPEGLPESVSEVRCPKSSCEMSYTVYSNEPITMYGEVRSLNVMRQMAASKIGDGHPFHGTKEFYWKGPAQGWRESETPEQRSKL